MEKKIEDSKPTLNRTRRQLLVGAALTPVVMTLHSAKVFAQDVDLQGGVSGAAPFSGAIAGSANVNGGGGDKTTELELYEAVCNDSNGNIRSYYGQVGSSSISTPLSEDEISTLSVPAWTVSTETPDLLKYNWTALFESRFADNINAVIDIFKTNLETLTSTSESVDLAAKQAAYNNIQNATLSLPELYTDGDLVNYKGYKVIKFFYDIQGAIPAFKSSITTVYGGLFTNNTGGTGGNGEGGNGGG